MSVIGPAALADSGGSTMVEPISLTLAGIVASLAASVVGGAAARVGEQMLDKGPSVLDRLVGRLRSRFEEAGDEAGSLALAQLEEVPDSPAREQRLTAELARHIDDDRSFRTELEELLAEARSVGIHVQTVTQSTQGVGNIEVAGLNNSSVNVSYGGPPPRGPG